MTAHQILEVLNHDSKNRFLKPFDRMHLHRQIANELNGRKVEIYSFIQHKIYAENSIYKFL